MKYQHAHRYYESDYVAVLSDCWHGLIETKGREDLIVAHEDRAAQLWCENATRLTCTEWQYIKVSQRDFEKLEATLFVDLTVFAHTALL